MNAKLVLALVLAFAILLTGCNGTVPSVTVEPTAVIPTEVPPTAVPSPTPTEVPTIAPTDVPTVTATPEPTVWEIAETMLAECTGAHPITEGQLAVDPTYQDQLETRVLQDHPEFPGNFFLQTGLLVLANDGVTPSPFAFVDLPNGSEFIPEMTICEGYVLALEYLNAENFDQDGVLVGEAYLFYEVGGTQPLVLDGELKEVHFTFPVVP